MPSRAGSSSSDDFAPEISLENDLGPHQAGAAVERSPSTSWESFRTALSRPINLDVDTHKSPVDYETEESEAPVDKECREEPDDASSSSGEVSSRVPVVRSKPLKDPEDQPEIRKPKDSEEQPEIRKRARSTPKSSRSAHLAGRARALNGAFATRPKCEPRPPERTCHRCWEGTWTIPPKSVRPQTKQCPRCGLWEYYGKDGKPPPADWKISGV
jgi:hypothetical protein